MTGGFPTREEIAEIADQALALADKHCRHGDSEIVDTGPCRDCEVSFMADALLARLRPAFDHWRNHYEAAQQNWNQTLNERDALVARMERRVNASVTKEVYAAQAETVTQLRADLRACAGALEAQGMRSLDDPSDWCCCGHGGTFDDTPDSGHFKECRQARAALARLGVQSEGKK